MGGDGGQVIDRATMVKTKGWGLTNNSGNRYSASLGEMANYVQMVTEDRGMGTLERHRTRMTQCFLSQDTLKDPVVACRLGNLYNKEAMIGALLNKKIPPGLSHIKKLSDLKNCVISWKEAENDGGLKVMLTEQASKHMVCPISHDDLDAGNSRAVVIWSTGAVVGLKSLKATKLKECPVTGKPFDFEQDVITIAPDDEELKKLTDRLPAAAKKRKVDKEKGAEASASAALLERPEAKFGKVSVVEGKFGKDNSDEADFQATKKQKKAAPEKDDGKPDDGLFKKATKETALYKSIFCNDREAMSGPRDAFGKPIYNQGSRCM